MLTHLGIYQCCNCKKQLDLMNTTVSIYLCCDKQFATCIQCARISCPKCNKQRIKRVNKNILNGMMVRERKESMLKEIMRQGDKKYQQQNMIKDCQQSQNETSTKDSKYTNHFNISSSNYNNNSSNSNNINNSSKSNPNNNNNNHCIKQQHKRNCIICELPITQQQYHHYHSTKTTSTTNKKQQQMQQQLMICKKCQQVNQRVFEKYYQPKNIKVVVEQQQQQQQQQKQQQIIKQEQEKINIKKKNKDKDNDDNENNQIQISSVNCVICEKQLIDSNNNNNKLMSEEDGLGCCGYDEIDGIKICISCKEFNKQTQRQFVGFSTVNKNKQTNHQSTKQTINTNQYNHITMTTIQKSRKQDQLDMGRKYSIDEAEQQLIQVDVWLFVDNDNEGDKNNNQIQNRLLLRQCQQCGYCLFESDGMLLCFGGGNGDSQKSKLQFKKQSQKQRKKFMCMLCANHQLSLSKRKTNIIPNNNNNSNKKLDRQIFIY